MELSINSQLDDETLSLPPPLTMEELMLERSIRSNSTTELCNQAEDKSHRSNLSQLKVKPALQQGYKSSSTSFCLPDPVVHNSAMHLTSSPSKKVTTFQLPSPIRPSSSNASYRTDANHHIGKVALLRSCQEYQRRLNKDEFVQDCKEYAVDSQYAGTCSKNALNLSSLQDETLPSTMFQDCSLINLSDVSPQRPISARSNATSVTLTANDVMSDQLRAKLIVMHSDNARLRTLVSNLRQQLEAFETKANTFSNTNQDVLSERIISLLDEVKTNEKTLRIKEDELEYREKESAGKDEIIFAMKKKVNHFQAMQEELRVQKTNAEALRDAACCEAELMSQKMQEMHAQMATKLQQSQGRACAEIKKLKEDRLDVMRECDGLKREQDSLKLKLRTSLRRLKFTENLNQSQDISSAQVMDEAQQRIRELIEELDDKRSTLKKCNADLRAMRDKNEVLKTQHDVMKEKSEHQTEMLESCQKEKEDMKAENETLKASIGQLKENLHTAESLQARSLHETTDHPIKETSEMKSPEISLRKHRSALSELTAKLSTQENHIRRLEARLASSASDGEKMEALQEELMALGEKHRAGERRANDLEDVVHLMENERTKYLKKVNDLEDQIQDQSRQCESLEKRLHDRTVVLNQSQRRVEELDMKVVTLEDETKVKKSELATLSGDATKLAAELSAANSKVSELQVELRDKSRTLEGITEHSSRQEAQHRREMRKIQKFHGEQSEDMKEQIESLQEESSKLKIQLKLAKREALLLNDHCAASGNRVQQLEAEVEQSRRDEENRMKSHQEALTILEEKSSASTTHVRSLEQTLEQCRSEVSGHIKQLHEAHDHFQNQLAMKSDQVAKLEADLKLASASLQDQSCRSMELETALEERHKMLDDAASRITELEESQALLQEEVAKQEQLYSRETGRKDQLISDMGRKLNVACYELEEKNTAFATLNAALEKVDEEFSDCKKEVAALEAKVESLHIEGEAKTQAAERLKFEWNEMKTKLNEKIEQAGAMEVSMQRTERELKKAEDKISNLQNELTQVGTRSQEMTENIAKLEAQKQSQDANAAQKEYEMSHLQETLMRYQRECDATNASRQDLEKLLDERQAELQHRAAQLAQLEMQLRGFESGMGKRNNVLEVQLNEVKGHLKERTNQVSGLDNEIASLRLNAGELRRVAEEQRENIRRLETKLAQKNERIEELSQTIQSNRHTHEERHNACIEASQEIRLAREREQETGKQYQDCKHDLQKLKLEKQQLLDDLNDVTTDYHDKDDRLLRLTNQLSQLQSEKVAMEARYRDELDQTHRDVTKMRQDHNEEVRRLAEVNGELAAKSRMIDSQQADDVEESLRRERVSRNETRHNKETITILEQELTARKQTIERNNDVIIVKDAEIARLQAQLSSVERGAMVDSAPGVSSQLSKEVVDRYPPSTTSANIQLPWTMDDVTSTSLFTGIDSNMTSYAGSFVPIAASTKRHPAEDLSAFVTSSPKHHSLHLQDGGAASGEEDSLYKRVFDDIFPASPDDTIPSHGGGINTEYPAMKNPMEKLDGELYPEKCMAQLQEKLRASERRRREVSSKLQTLKS